MDQTSFHVQGSRTGNDARLDFFLQRGRLHYTKTEFNIAPPAEGWPEGYDPRPAWRPDEVLVATWTNKSWNAIKRALRDSDGDLHPGTYEVVFEKYENVTEGLRLLPSVPDGDTLSGSITVEKGKRGRRVHCSIDEKIVVQLLVSILSRAATHKDLRLPDRAAALSSMLMFVDAATYTRCAHRVWAAMEILKDRLRLEPPKGRTVFLQTRTPFDPVEFRTRLANPGAIVHYYELRTLFNVEHETLNSWLGKADISKSVHGRAFTCTVRDFLKLVKHLKKTMHASPIGSKIHASLQSIGMA